MSQSQHEQPGSGGGRVVLEATGLRLSFGGVHAVDGLDLTVREGEFVSIIGPNGSGKTTTVNLLSGVLRPDAGEVRIAGALLPPGEPDAAAEAGLARTFQNGRVFGQLTVAENITIGQHTTLRAARPLRRIARWPVVRWLPLLAELALALAPTRAVRSEAAAAATGRREQIERFAQRLGPRADDEAYTLSYANRRRTEIARALAARPQVLLLDEPAAGMNQTETAEIGEQLRVLREGGQTIVLVEHKLEIVNALSDRVIVLDEGAIIAAGTAAEVTADPRVVQAYLGARRLQGRSDQGEDAHDALR